MNQTTEIKAEIAAPKQPDYSKMTMGELAAIFDLFGNFVDIATAFQCQPRVTGDDQNPTTRGDDFIESLKIWIWDNQHAIAKEVGSRKASVTNSSVRTGILAQYVCTVGSEEIEVAIGSVIDGMWGRV